MARVTVDSILKLNDNDVALEGFKDSRVTGDDVGDYLNAATVTFSVLDASGTVVAGPTTMSYVASSKGNYLGNLASTDTTSLVVDGIYYVEVTAVEGDVNGFWREQSVVKDRET